MPPPDERADSAPDSDLRVDTTMPGRLLAGDGEGSSCRVGAPVPQEGFIDLGPGETAIAQIPAQPRIRMPTGATLGDQRREHRVIVDEPLRSRGLQRELDRRFVMTPIGQLRSQPALGLRRVRRRSTDKSECGPHVVGTGRRRRRVLVVLENCG